MMPIQNVEVLSAGGTAHTVILLVKIAKSLLSSSSHNTFTVTNLGFVTTFWLYSIFVCKSNKIMSFVLC